MVVARVTEKIAILGSTGSVGVNTLEVVRMHPDRYQVKCLAANTNVREMLEQCAEFSPEVAVMADAEAAGRLQKEVGALGLQTEVLAGPENIERVVAEGMDAVVCAIVGAAGLSSTLAAVRAGIKVLIANKEPLVMLGEYIVDLARQHDALILPLDSEHNAIFQCLPLAQQQSLGSSPLAEHGVHRILLTGSGGPFRQLSADQFRGVTPERACAHPNWNMGRKISVDSATLMNKGLELIEACSLFAVDESKVDIVIHPQSIIHSMVEYVDGSILAQMANPDMKVPIANALAWPERIETGVSRLDLFQRPRFDFEAPDTDRFPAVEMSRKAARQGGTAPCILNAANEIAVEAFLAQRIRFDQITEVVARTLEKSMFNSTICLETVLRADHEARAVSRNLIAALQS